MSTWRRVLIAILLAFLNAAAAQTANEKSVAFELVGNNILVPVRINGSAPLWFVFDTGAAPNVINSGVVAKLGLRGEKAGSLNALGGEVEAGVIRGVSIDIGGVELANQDLATAPLDAMSILSGRDIQGIVGNAFIHHFVVEIDYKRRRLTFRDPRQASLAGAPDAIELYEHNGVPYIEATLVAGGTPVANRFEIDTGSNGYLSINSRFAETQRLMERLPNGTTAEGIGGAGVGGDTKSTDARIDSLTIGGHTLRRPIINIVEAPGGYSAGEDAGFIGSKLLRRFTITLDYQSHRLELRPNADFGRPFEIDLSGLELEADLRDLHRIRIRHIRAGFPAAAAGLKEGDELVTVNGHPAASIGISHLTEQFEHPGWIDLLIRRGNRTMRIRLRLKSVI